MPWSSYHALAAGAIVSIGVWYVRSGRKKSGMPACSFLDLIELVRTQNSTEWIIKRKNQLGPIFSFPSFLPPTVILTSETGGIELLALEAQYKMEVKMPPGYTIMHGLEIHHIHGDQHRNWRRIFNNVITPRAIQSYIEPTERSYKLLFENLLNRPKAEIYEELRLTQLRLACETLFGIIFDSFEEAEFRCAQTQVDMCEIVVTELLMLQYRALERAFEAEFKGITAMPIYLPGFDFFNGYNAAQKIKKILRNKMTSALSERKAKPSTNVSEPVRNVIEILTEVMEAEEAEGRQVDLNLVVNNLLLIMEAGHHTTVYSETFLLAALCQPEYAHCLARLKAETATIEPPLTVDKLSTMTYADASMKEALRMCPFVGSFPHIVGKECGDEPPLQLGGHVIAPGTSIVAFYNHLFVDPDVFPDPHRFIPDRWLGKGPGDVERMKKVFLPFAAGQHVCLGQKIAAMQFKVLAYTLTRGGYEMAPCGPLVMGESIIPVKFVKDGLVAVVRRQAGAGSLAKK